MTTILDVTDIIVIVVRIPHSNVFSVLLSIGTMPSVYVFETNTLVAITLMYSMCPFSLWCLLCASCGQRQSEIKPLLAKSHAHRYHWCCCYCEGLSSEPSGWIPQLSCWLHRLARVSYEYNILETILVHPHRHFGLNWTLNYTAAL